MFEVYFLWSLALVWIIFAVFSDMKTREIPNWLNFSLVIFALAFRFFYSLFVHESFSFFYQGLIGFGIFLLLGNLLYYSKLFAGGDAKLFMSLGAVLPIFLNFKDNVKVFVLFLIVYLISGAIYGIFMSIYFGIRNWEKLKKEFCLQLKENRKMIIFFLFMSFVLIFFSFFIWEIFYVGVFCLFMIYFYLYIKSVDESCMVKFLKVSDITEGDWLYEDLEIGKRLIKAKWDGLTNEEISFLFKHVEKVWIRWGIQFAPVFLISFLVVVLVLIYGLFGF